MDKPKWLTMELFHRSKTAAESDPSYQKYIRNAVRFQRWYLGEIMLAPTSDFDDMEVDEENAVARRNLIQEGLNDLNSMLIKNRPIVRRWPYHIEDAGLSDDMDAMHLAEWKESNGQSVLRSLLQDAQITGLGIAKVMWDPLMNRKNKGGGILFQVLPPGSVLVDPAATNLHRMMDASFIMHHTRQRPRDLIMRYGQEAEVAFGLRSSVTKTDAINPRMLNMSDEELLANIGDTRGKDSVDPRVDVYEWWVFPEQTRTALLSLGMEIKPDSVYPYGLVATVCRDHFLRVMPNPFMSRRRVKLVNEEGVPTERVREIGHKRHPYVPLWWNRIGDSSLRRGFWDCMGMVEAMVSMQFNINALRRNIAINARTIANPPTAINSDAIDMPASSIKMGPSEIIPISPNYTPADAIQILKPGEMPAYVFQMLLNDMVGIKETSGLKPGAAGLFPQPGGGTSHTPAQTIGALQESAWVSLWMFVDEITDGLLDLSVLFDGIIQQKFKSDVYVATTRAGNQRYVEWNARHITAEFRREVVSAATTPIFDMERENKAARMEQITATGLSSGDPMMMRMAVITLEILRDPWAYQYIQLLNEAIQNAQNVQEQMQQLGAAALGQGQGVAGAPEGGNQETGLAELAAELGISEQELLANVQ